MKEHIDSMTGGAAGAVFGVIAMDRVMEVAICAALGALVGVIVKEGTVWFIRNVLKINGKEPK